MKPTHPVLSWLLLLLGVAAPSGLWFPTAVLARPATGTLVAQLKLPPTPQRGSAKETAGGGVRGGCVAEDQQRLIKAIMPRDSKDTLFVRQPTLLWQIPKTKAVRVEVLIRDRQKKEVYLQSRPLPDMKQDIGLLKVDLPPNTLQPNQPYLWDLALICDPDDRSADVYLQGAVVYTSWDRLQIQDKDAIWQYLRQGIANRSLTLKSEDPALKALVAGKPLTPAQKEQITLLVKTHLQTLQAQQAARSQDPANTNVAIAQEMAQLYALFDLGPDMVFAFAPVKEKNPQEWRQILQFAGVDVPGVTLMEVPATKDNQNLINNF